MRKEGLRIKLLLCLLTCTLSLTDVQAQKESHEIVVERYARLRMLPSVASETRFQFPAYARVQTRNFDGMYWYVEYKQYKGYIIDSAIEASDDLRALLLNAEVGHRLDEKDIAVLDALKKAPGTIDPNVILAGDPNAERLRIELTQKGIVVGLSGGLATPMQPPKLADYWKSSFQLAGQLGYRFNTVFEIDFEISNLGLPIDEEAALLLLNEDNKDQDLEESLAIRSAFLNLKFHMGGYNARVSPYLFFGGGAFVFRASNAEFEYTESNPPDFLFQDDESVSGFNLGGGLAVHIARQTFLYAEASGLFGVTRNEGTFLIPIRTGFFVLL